MLYKLLGIAVWKGGKVLLRRNLGIARAPKPLLVGGLLLGIAGVVLAARTRGDD